MYASIDQAITRLEAQIRNRKELLADHKGIKKRAFPSTGPSVLEAGDDIEVIHMSPLTLSLDEAKKHL